MRADRLVAILLLLQQRDQVTAAQVARELEVSERTARRDLDALAMAGDRTLGVADKVRVIRQVPGRAEPVVSARSVRNAKRTQADNLRLAPGDLVSVEETPITFVLEAMRSFIRFGFSSGVDM